MRWLDKELRILKENYATSTIGELRALLLYRTVDMINTKIKRLRAVGELGNKTKETKRRAYDQRGTNFIFTIDQTSKGD
ncbi:hypothetical protein DRQ25_01720 [Candidatus Fermentibacteria bacterium]|nr:MAG: hypothetical protein DRQ25_01720 [Candidatus Fermentibacteria bacterium]